MISSGDFPQRVLTDSSNFCWEPVSFFSICLPGIEVFSGNFFAGSLAQANWIPLKVMAATMKNDVAFLLLISNVFMGFNSLMS